MFNSNTKLMYVHMRKNKHNFILYYFSLNMEQQEETDFSDISSSPEPSDDDMGNDIDDH